MVDQLIKKSVWPNSIIIDNNKSNMNCHLEISSAFDGIGNFLALPYNLCSSIINSGDDRPNINVNTTYITNFRPTLCDFGPRQWIVFFFQTLWHFVLKMSFYLSLIDLYHCRLPCYNIKPTVMCHNTTVVTNHSSVFTAIL